MNNSLAVAVAVIRDSCGQVLLSKRASNKHQGNLWEFPGGKIEAGETPEAALQREIQEELAISITSCKPMLRLAHNYTDLSVVLHVFLVESFIGQPRGAEGQPLRWVLPSQLSSLAMPAANLPIVRTLQLPKRYLITPDSADTAQLIRGCLGAVDNGIELLQLRAPQLAAEDYFLLADQLVKALPASVTLMLKGDIADILPRKNAGWHLTSTQLLELAGQPRPLASNLFLAASCHNATELKLAAELGCDFATLSPVLPTATHPDAPCLGWDAAQLLVTQAQLPVYLLGGMSVDNLPRACATGAQGIAAIRGLWPITI